MLQMFATVGSVTAFNWPLISTHHWKTDVFRKQRNETRTIEIAEAKYNYVSSTYEAFYTYVKQW